MKRKPVILVLALIGVLVWWLFPKHIFPTREKVSEIIIESGLNGKSYTLKGEELDALYADLESVYEIRIIPKMFATGGYSYLIYDCDHEENWHHSLTLYEGGLCLTNGVYGLVVGKTRLGSLNETFSNLIEAINEG